MCFIEDAGISSDETASALHIAHHAQESAEKKFAAVTISRGILASPGAAAQDKTRAEIGQELVEAQQYGLNSSPRPLYCPKYRHSHPFGRNKNVAQPCVYGVPTSGQSVATAASSSSLSASKLSKRKRIKFANRKH
jgi:hypothetical protein